MCKKPTIILINYYNQLLTKYLKQFNKMTPKNSVNLVIYQALENKNNV